MKHEIKTERLHLFTSNVYICLQVDILGKLEQTTLEEAICQTIEKVEILHQKVEQKPLTIVTRKDFPRHSAMYFHEWIYLKSLNRRWKKHKKVYSMQEYNRLINHYSVMVACPGWIKSDLLELTRNGIPVEFPHLAQASSVVRKAIKDAKRGRDVSVYGAFVNWERFLAKITPHRIVMRTWMQGIKKYI
ncbi:MAG: uncharacterized protein PWP24_1138 [Clostridiales bacterium]|nr:uncharacterized protein [Clostridiales bacterium]